MRENNQAAGKTWTYAYDDGGKRITKTVDGTAYNYHYLGDQLVELTWGGNKLHFTYDSTGPLSVSYNGTEYFYVKNAQGDVTVLVNASGTRVVSYTYDAWGNLLTTTGSLATTLGAQNPLRYRGYVYDTETGLYYLQSRYYNPGWGRFINADAYLSTGQGFNGHNMFAYCGNNPISRYDVGGMFWKETIRGSFKAINNAGIERGIDTAAIGAFFLQMYKEMKAFTTQALIVGNSFLGIIICMISFSTWVLVVNLQNFPLHIMGKNISYGCGREIILIWALVLNWEYIRGG